MIRVIVRESDYSAAAHVEGMAASVAFRTFDVELPEIEAYLTKPPSTWTDRQFVGIEIVPTPATIPPAMTEPDHKCACGGVFGVGFCLACIDAGCPANGNNPCLVTGENCEVPF